jgi:hypothetical protein
MTNEISERRQVARQRALLRGKLLFNHGLNVADCTIRDISERGARLVFSEAIATPDELELHIPQKGQTIKVRIAWRRAQEAGVVFQTAAQATPALDPHQIAERFARLEAEIATLKRLFKKLKSDPGPETEVA